MKAKAVEIVWHSKEPVLSVDFHDNTRFATAGADCTVKVWGFKYSKKNGAEVGFLSNLSLHAKAVNVVRFSPNGAFLASGSDDGKVVIWKLSEQPAKESSGNLMDDQAENKENWTVFGVLRSHLEDVYDLSWSACSRYLVSGSVDNTVIVWDIMNKCLLQKITDHTHYVQGVALDPLGKVLASQSSDRTCRIFALNEKKKEFSPLTCVKRTERETISVDESESGSRVKHKLYLDETLQTFFRRLKFTPDGSLLISPSGFMKTPEKETNPSDTKKKMKSTINCTFVFSRNNFDKPAVYLPSTRRASVAVRCSPIFYKLRNPSKEESQSPLCDLPYRMIFAIATMDSVLIYDTEQMHPIAAVSNIHCSTLTDITWSRNGDVILVSSTDGYCSAIVFEDGELGTPLTKDMYPTYLKECLSMRMKDLYEVKTCDNKENNAKVLLGEVKSPEPVRIESPIVKAFTKANVAEKKNPPSSQPEGAKSAKTRRIAPILISPGCERAAPSVESSNNAVEAKVKRRIQPTLLTASPSDNNPTTTKSFETSKVDNPN
eukprot:Nk52_evm80s270 gene=Nk52_evmTU80s270